MSKSLFLVALLFIFPYFVFAQERILKGTVADDKGSPVPGATVQVKGGRSAQTDNLVPGYFFFQHQINEAVKRNEYR